MKKVLTVSLSPTITVCIFEVCYSVHKRYYKPSYYLHQPNVTKAAISRGRLVAPAIPGPLDQMGPISRGRLVAVSYTHLDVYKRQA